MSRNRSLPRGLLAGAIAGLAGSLVMDAFQSLVARTTTELSGAAAPRGENTTEKTAREVTEHFGGSLRGMRKQHAGRAVHYAFGTAMGALYGAAAELFPVVRLGGGTAFGTVLLLATDEWSLPLLNLASKPSETAPKDHLLHWASHLTYSASLEGGRSLVRRSL